MISLEDRLRPRDDVHSPRMRDATAWAMLLMLGVAMLPAWWVDRTFLAGLGSGNTNDVVDVVERFSGLMLSFWLLPAMGFMLALRCGAVDLSVWVVSAIGGLVAVAMLNAGYPYWSALPVGVAAGAAMGVVNGALVAGLRLPCPVVSLLAALGGVWFLAPVLAGWAAWPMVALGREVTVRPEALDGLLGGFESLALWTGLPEATLQAIAAVIIFACYATTMLVILYGEMVERHRKTRFNERWRLFAALVGSGTLSAAGGVIAVIQHQMTPIPLRPVDGLVIPAAALLAGGLYLAGPGRTLLAGVLLPVALAVATAWRQEVLNLRWDLLPGFAPQTVLLIVMVAVARYAMTCSTSAVRWRRWAVTLAWNSCAGVAVLGASVWADSPTTRSVLQATGGLFWLLAAGGAIALKLAASRRRDAPSGAQV